MARVQELKIAAASAAAIALGATAEEANAAAQGAAEGVGAAAAAGAGAVLSVRAAADAQRVRDEFTLATAKAKAILNPPLVIMLLLYPSVIGFTITARYTKYSLLIPTPNVPGAVPPSALRGPQDEWVTVSARALWCTILSFLVVVVIHLYILVHLTLKGPPGSPMMSGAYAWIAPMVFWFSTSTYFIIYTTLARYGVDFIECVIAGIASGLLLLVTLILICVVGQRPRPAAGPAAA